MKKVRLLPIFGLILTSALALSPLKTHATTNINSIISSMTTKQKVAEMIMPSFRWSCESMSGCNITSITSDVEDLLEEYNFAGVILFSQNITGTEQITRFIDELQSATASNPDKNSQLLIATDQEGGYVTRLAYGTNMPGNMALGATNDPTTAYEASKVIGTELDAVGFNTDFAPVSDVNNNPSNPVIGVRSFSDDPNTVGNFASYFMKGLEETNITAALKHFPGHGDTSTDTHSSMTVVNKSYSELKSLELVPFQRLVNEGVDLIMTAHIQYPQIEDTTYTSIHDGSTITLPATLSEKIITDVLRTDMGYNGVVVTDALDMGAIATHFDKYDTAKLAIEAGVDILLMPVETNGTTAISELKTYIETVANMIDNGEISETKVDQAVTRILTLKNKKGLLQDYTSNVESKVTSALSTVSTKENHDKEFELAKKAITVVKNDDSVLPLSTDDKTLVLYYYDSHYTAFNYALKRLISDNIITSSSNVSFIDYGATSEEEIKAAIKDTDNVVVINSLYGLSSGAVNGTYYSLLSNCIDYANDSSKNTVFMSTQLPYDIARFTNADAIVATYLASGVSFDNLEDYNSNIPKYGANVIAGFYQMFNKDTTLTGKLPVNIYSLNDDYTFSSAILYNRGYGLTYASKSNTEESSSSSTVKTPNSGSGGSALKEAGSKEELSIIFIPVVLSVAVFISRAALARHIKSTE